MAIGVALSISIIGSLIAYQLTIGQSGKRKRIIWGITLMIAIAAPISFTIGLLTAIAVQNGWAVGIMFYIFPVIFLIGLITLIAGIRTKKESLL